MTLVDNYFPFDTAPGNNASSARWRLMARLWCGSGVVPGYLSSFAPTLAGSVITTQSGAAWIDGFYGEMDESKTFTTSGNGMLVARMDPTAEQILLMFIPGQTTPTQSPTGLYEVPIARVTSGALVDIRQFISGGGTPAGVMWDYGGATAPAGWLLCNGASYLVSDYPALSSAIGYTYGGSGANFSVPDCRGRSIVGAGAGTGLTSRALAAKGGEETHLLVIGEVAAHGHTGSVSGTSAGVSANHIHSGVTGTGGALIQVNDAASTEALVVGGNGTHVTGFGGPSVSTGANSVNHSHTFSDSFTTANAGSGTAHNNMQPYLAVNKIIKT